MPGFCFIQPIKNLNGLDAESEELEEPEENLEVKEEA